MKINTTIRAGFNPQPDPVAATNFSGAPRLRANEPGRPHPPGPRVCVRGPTALDPQRPPTVLRRGGNPHGGSRAYHA